MSNKFNALCCWVRDVRYTARDGLNWMDWALRPYAVLPGFNLTRPRPA